MRATYLRTSASALHAQGHTPHVGSGPSLNPSPVPTSPTPVMTSVEDGKISGMESAAKSLLTQAVELDREGRKVKALTCYTEGIALLMNIKKSVTDASRKENLDKRLLEYLNRAEKLKQIIEKDKKAGTYRETYKIEANSTGHSYARIFRYLIDEELKEVVIEDPYIRIHHQLLNLVRFAEMLIVGKREGLCPALRSLRLLTGKEAVRSRPSPSPGDRGGLQGQQGQQQETAFLELSRGLSDYGVTLRVEYSTTLHDREIRLSNGWVVKIGRGLDFFKSSSKYSLGACEQYLRPCHETTVEIFHQNQR